VTLKLMHAFLAIALMPIVALHAQPASPAGRYLKKRGGVGEMRVEKTGEGWRVFVSAGGIPRGGATAADCTVMAVGNIKGNTFEGEIKHQLDPVDRKATPDNAVESGHKMTITFVKGFATVSAADVEALCGMGTGVFGRYTKGGK
jgi:hypothetical protein